MSQRNHTSAGGLPPFLPGFILIGTFAIVLAVLLSNAGSADAPASQRTPTAVSVMPTATLSIPATSVPATAEADVPTAAPTNLLTAIAVGSSVDQPAATSTPGNVLTAIAVGAGPQAVTNVPAQSGAGTTPALSATSLSPSPSAVVQTEAAATPTNIAETTPVLSDTAPDPALVSQGQTAYQTSCAACHGFDGRGIPGLGKDLVTGTFVHDLTDEELLEFIIVGRDASHPENTTGIPMPPRGGNASLTDEQILAIIAYLRSEASG